MRTGTEIAVRQQEIENTAKRLIRKLRVCEERGKEYALASHYADEHHLGYTNEVARAGRENALAKRAFDEVLEDLRTLIEKED